MTESKGRMMQSTLSRNLFSAASSSGDEVVVSSVRPLGPDGLASSTTSTSACRALRSRTVSDIAMNSRAEEYTRLGVGIEIEIRIRIGKRRNRSHVYVEEVESSYVNAGRILACKLSPAIFKRDRTKTRSDIAVRGRSEFGTAFPTDPCATRIGVNDICCSTSALGIRNRNHS